MKTIMRGHVRAPITKISRSADLLQVLDHRCFAVSLEPSKWESSSTDQKVLLPIVEALPLQMTTSMTAKDVPIVSLATSFHTDIRHGKRVEMTLT